MARLILYLLLAGVALADDPTDCNHENIGKAGNHKQACAFVKANC